MCYDYVIMLLDPKPHNINEAHNIHPIAQALWAVLLTSESWAAHWGFGPLLIWIA